MMYHTGIRIKCTEVSDKLNNRSRKTEDDYTAIKKSILSLGFV